MTTVAIDFGTTNTVVSILEPDTQTPKTLRFPSISRLLGNQGENGAEVPVIPTLVYIEKPNQLLFGEEVRSQRLGLSQPERLFKAFKRDIVADSLLFFRDIDGQEYTTKSVAEEFLQKIWRQLKEQKIEPSEVIFTIPVGSFETYRHWFQDFATRVLKVAQVKFVDESTAAALGYGVEKPGSVVLVVDFGGGTLDLSLVRTVSTSSNDLKAEVLAKSDADVGGEDIDRWIVEDYLQEQNLTESGVGEIGFANLLEIAEKLKINLADKEEVKESWFDDESFFAHELELTQEKLKNILENRLLFSQLGNALDEVVEIAKDKGFSKNDIEQVLLVGGSCQILAVQELVISYFASQKVKLDKPFEAVSHGALALNKLIGVNDYLRHSYVIPHWEPRWKNYSYDTSLFNEGTKYPCQREEIIFQVANDGQKKIRLDICEVADKSDREVVFDKSGKMITRVLRARKEYRSLASYLVSLKPPGKVKQDRISVKFEVNQRRVLLVTVIDLLTGKVLVNKKKVIEL